MSTDIPDPNAKDLTPLDLEGAKQHHNLKNQPGEAGDPTHADGEAAGDAMKSSIADGGADNDTQIADALKKTTE